MKIQGYAQAQRIAKKAMTPRAEWLDKLERYVLGTQYDGRPGFWDDSNVPLWERQPCIVYQAVEAAIAQYKNKVLGEDRWPDVTSRMSWDNDGEAMSDVDAEALDLVLQNMSSMSKFQTKSSEAFAWGQGVGTSVSIVGVRNDKICIDTVKPSWCTPEFDVEGCVTKLVIQYPYVDTTKTIKGKPVARAMMYRREVDVSKDTIFLPVEFKEDDDLESIRWVEDKDKSIVHGLGFCPVHWYARKKGCSIEGRVDGHALHETQLDEIDGLNFAISQKHQAALFLGGPIIVEIGVDPGYNPSGSGRAARVMAQSSPMGGSPDPVSNPLHSGGYLSPEGGRNGNKRRKSPNQVWQYERSKQDTDVKMLALDGTALKALEEHCSDLRNKLCEALGVVFLDTENIPKGHAMSGSAMEALLDRFLAHCDEERADFGDGFIVPMYGMMLRIAVHFELPVPGLDKAKAVIDRIGDLWAWHSPPLELSWGEYSTPTPEEEKAQVDAVVALKGINLLSRRAAVKMLRSIIGVENIDDYIKELDEDEEIQAQKEESKAMNDHGRQMDLVSAKAAAKPPTIAKGK